eukprot:TRINITY_DN8352_c0_g1_i3.p1 TRINITY_DN8352_c0_g1~~TRINITY_DN8352_c0_g1_i3.p1  ORF type:complete len:262 (+),score=-25.24 TRINITY_DN8352_c0_g1_i3:73-786(+)
MSKPNKILLLLLFLLLHFKFKGGGLCCNGGFHQGGNKANQKGISTFKQLNKLTFVFSINDESIHTNTTFSPHTNKILYQTKSKKQSSPLFLNNLFCRQLYFSFIFQQRFRSLDQMNFSLQLCSLLAQLKLLRFSHTFEPKSILPRMFYFLNLRYLLVQQLLKVFPIILYAPISSPFKFQRSILRQFFSSQFSECFCPTYFSRIPFHFKVLVTFGSTKPEDRGVVSHKNNSMSRIYFT